MKTTRIILPLLAAIAGSVLPARNLQAAKAGDLDTSFNANVDGAMDGVAVQGDGKIVIVGAFTTVNGVAHPHVARLNADGSLDTAFTAVHGYSREFLRRHGVCPYEAHAAFRAYAGDLPLVAYNLSFDWNRVLEPEYARLSLPVTGRRGFCALTLTRRVVREVANYRLETIKNHFALNEERSHRGRNDVETTVALIERVVSPHLHRAGVHGFAAVAAFARRTPVAACLAHIHGAARSLA